MSKTERNVIYGKISEMVKPIVEGLEKEGEDSGQFLKSTITNKLVRRISNEGTNNYLKLSESQYTQMYHVVIFQLEKIVDIAIKSTDTYSDARQTLFNIIDFEQYIPDKTNNEEPMPTMTKEEKETRNKDDILKLIAAIKIAALEADSDEVWVNKDITDMSSNRYYKARNTLEQNGMIELLPINKKDSRKYLKIVNLELSELEAKAPEIEKQPEPIRREITPPKKYYIAIPEIDKLRALIRYAKAGDTTLYDSIENTIDDVVKMINGLGFITAEGRA